MMYVMFGFAGGIICTYWVRKVHNLGHPLRCMLIIAVIGILGITIVAGYEMIYVLGVMLAIAGTGIIGFIPAAVEACIERLDLENLNTTILFTFA